MTDLPTAADTRYLLRALRRVRTAHRTPTVDRVTAALGVLIIGGFPVQLVINLVRSGEFGLAGTAGPWVVLGCGIVLAGLVLAALQAMGPLVVGRAVETLLLSAPLHRATLLRGRLLGLTAVLVVIGALAGGLGAAVGGAGSAGPVIGSALAGAGVGVLLSGVAVSLQRSGFRNAGRWVAGAGLALTVLVLVLGAGLPTLAAWGNTLTGLCWLLAVAVTGAAHAGLGGLDREMLTAGAALAGAGLASALFLDLSLLGGVVTGRRALRLGRVPVRRLPGSRVAALLAADVRRLGRFRGGQVSAVALLVLPYVAARVLPAGGVIAMTTIGAAAVAALSAGGLRAVCRSADLRRLLGGTDGSLRLAHLVLPVTVSLCWTALALPALSAAALAGAAVIPAAAVAFTYLQATAKQPDFTVALFDVGFGPMPLAAVWRLLRGVFALVAGIGLQLLLLG